MVGINNNEYIWLDVTQNIARQRGLIIMSGILRLIVSGWSYVLGTMFVRRSLRDLLVLKKKLDRRNVESPEWSLYADHLPVDDEINRIAHAITKLENRVQSHYSQLRDFVWHVSHELKTPLMEIRSDLDLINRTQAYEKLPSKVSNHISHMQRIIDTMFLLTRLDEKTPITTETVSIQSLLQKVIDSQQKTHNNRNTFTTQYNNDIVIQWHPELAQTFLNNILDNACKYSPPQTPIIINISGNTLTITNTGDLTEKTLQNMREPFRQADKNRVDGLGIGLALVKQIATIHEWEIVYKQLAGSVIAEISFAH